MFLKKFETRHSWSSKHGIHVVRNIEDLEVSCWKLGIWKFPFKVMTKVWRLTLRFRTFQLDVFQLHTNSKHAWSHKKRRMRIVKRRVEDMKNRFEEFRVTNEQQKLGDGTNGKRTMVERMQEWLQKYECLKYLKYISWRSTSSRN